MRRVVIATAGTVVGLVLLLGYRSEGAVKVEKVSAGTGTGIPARPPPPPRARAQAQALGPRSRRGPLRAPTGPTRARTSPTVTATSWWRSPWRATGSSPSLCRRTTRSPQYSQTVNSAAVPVLEREAVAAQGINFDVVSGATYTSDAFAQSLQSALDKATMTCPSACPGQRAMSTMKKSWAQS